MNDDSFTNLEQQLAARANDAIAPGAIRDTVLTAARRELRSQRWDRRLGRAAVGLLVAGVGFNVAAGLTSERVAPMRQSLASDAGLVQSAVAFAQATDIETGRLLAHQLAAWQGRSVSPQQLAAIDAALNAATNKSQL
jgi:hypothetical protein